MSLRVGGLARLDSHDGPHIGDLPVPIGGTPVQIRIASAFRLRGPGLDVLEQLTAHGASDMNSTTTRAWTRRLDDRMYLLGALVDGDRLRRAVGVVAIVYPDMPAHVTPVVIDDREYHVENPRGPTAGRTGSEWHKAELTILADSRDRVVAALAHRGALRRQIYAPVGMQRIQGATLRVGIRSLPPGIDHRYSAVW